MDSGYWAHLNTSTSDWTLDTLTITVQTLKLILGTLIHFKIWLDNGHTNNHSSKSKWILGMLINTSTLAEYYTHLQSQFNVLNWYWAHLYTSRSDWTLDTVTITVQSLNGYWAHLYTSKSDWTLDTLTITVQSLKLILGTLIHFKIWLDNGHTNNHSSKSKWILGTLINTSTLAEYYTHLQSQFNVWMDIGHTYTLQHQLDIKHTYNHSSASE